MDNNRLETLEQFLAARPDDCFVRYGLAQEYIKHDRFAEAIEQFNRIFKLDAGYQAAYYHAGKTYEKMGRADDARTAYEKGIETARRSGDLHARGELEVALGELTGS